jgi:hypothetical protein
MSSVISQLDISALEAPSSHVVRMRKRRSEGDMRKRTACRLTESEEKLRIFVEARFEGIAVSDGR